MDLIKKSIILSNYVSKYVRLKRNADNKFVGLCPFHKEKTPSFYVDDNIGSFYCFGCNSKGDIISFAMQMHSKVYKDAITMLSIEYGIKLPWQDPSRNQMYDINESVNTLYKKNLIQNKDAIQYLRNRNISKESIIKYSLGYADENILDIKNALITFDKNEIKKMKLIFSGRFGDYNPLQNRLIFPIINKDEKVIGFGGRIIDENKKELKAPKYINSYETELFKKKDVLYGVNIVKKSLNQLKKDKQFQVAENQDLNKYDELNKIILIVEGYIDVIQLNQCKIHSVGVLGTSLHAGHITQIYELFGDNIVPVICMDNDEAGKKSVKRISYDLLQILTPLRRIFILELKEAKDVDEFLKKNKSEILIDKIIQNKKSLIDHIFENEIISTLKDFSPEQMSFAEERINELTKKIKHVQLAYHTKNYLREKLKQIIYKKNNKWQNLNLTKQQLNKKNELSKSLPIQNNENIYQERSQILFGIIKNNKNLINDNLIERISLIDFQDETVNFAKNIFIKFRSLEYELFFLEIDISNNNLFKSFQKFIENIDTKINTIYNSVNVIDLLDGILLLFELDSLRSDIQRTTDYEQILKMKQKEMDILLKIKHS